MKPLFSLLIFSLLLSCNNRKVIQLPEINHSEINDVLDVSPAYIFYDETKPDSVELNRKNLISTTNWLVNVDKRLTLEQAIPKIKFLQNKKKNSSHKKEGVKNYFTCNNTSIKNLGFLEFTKTLYEIEANTIHTHKFDEMRFTKDSIQFYGLRFKNLNSLFNHIKKDSLSILLSFDKHLNFQKYIRIKSKLEQVSSPAITISNSEFIY